MSRLAIKAIRSVTATILIVGSIYVQHVVPLTAAQRVDKGIERVTIRQEARHAAHT